MNTITKIALSLSLTALVAQHMHAAPYSDHAKKSVKIAWHSGQVLSGALFAFFPVFFTHQTLANPIKYDLSRSGVALLTGFTAIITATMLNSGVRGLKKEICPNFKPIAWIKNKLGKKSEQPA